MPALRCAAQRFDLALREAFAFDAERAAERFRGAAAVLAVLRAADERRALAFFAIKVPAAATAAAPTTAAATCAVRFCESARTALAARRETTVMVEEPELEEEEEAFMVMGVMMFASIVTQPKGKFPSFPSVLSPASPGAQTSERWAHAPWLAPPRRDMLGPVKAAPSPLKSVAASLRRAPAWGLVLAVLGLAWLAIRPWPGRNPQPADALIALAYTAVVLTLLLSVRARSRLAAAYRMPLCGYGVLVLGGAIVALKVGHWPWYSHPDPKVLHWPLLTTPVALISFTALFAIPIGAIALLGTMARLEWTNSSETQWRTLKRNAAWLGLGVCAWGFDIARDGGLLSWIMD